MSDWQEANATNDQTWDGKDQIEGKYTSKKTDVGPNHSNMYTLVNQDGSVGVWGSTVLDSKFAQIPIGSEVRIKSLGMAKSQAGKEYKDYQVLFREAPFQEVADLPTSEINVKDIPF